MGKVLVMLPSSKCPWFGDVSINHLEPTAFIQSHGFCVSKPILVYSNVNQLMLGGDILCEDEAV